MHFVDDIHALFHISGRKNGLLAKGAHIVDAVVRRGVELQNIQYAAVVNAEAGEQALQGLPFLRIQAIDGLGQNFRACGLTRPACAHKQVGVGHAPGRDLIFERIRDMCLADDIVKCLGAPFSV
jgi:hypothetical protein